MVNNIFFSTCKEASAYRQTISCIETVLMEILEHKFTPQVINEIYFFFVRLISIIIINDWRIYKYIFISTYLHVYQINDTNSTRFAKCISNLHHQETISHLLVGSVPLELVVDIGFEKLTRDYLYILRGARLVDLYGIRKKLNDTSSGIFNTENYR